MCRRQSFGGFEHRFLRTVQELCSDGKRPDVCSALSELGIKPSAIHQKMTSYGLMFSLPENSPDRLQECLNAFWEAYCNKAATVA